MGCIHRAREFDLHKPLVSYTLIDLDILICTNYSTIFHLRYYLHSQFCINLDVLYLLNA